MTGAVAERLAQSVRVEHLRAAASTSVVALPGLTASIAAACASRTAAWSLAASGDGWPTDTVRVKSEQYPSKTPPKSSTTRSPACRPVAGAIVRQGRIRPGRDNRVEGRTLVAGPPERRLDHRGDLPLADSRPDGAERRPATAVSPSAARSIAITSAASLTSRNCSTTRSVERSVIAGAPGSRCGSATRAAPPSGGRPRCRCRRPSVSRQPRRAPRRSWPAHPRRAVPDRRPAMPAARGPPPCSGSRPADDIARRDDERSGGPDVVGEIADVGRRGDDQRVETERLERAPDADVPGGEDVRSRAARSGTFVGKDRQPRFELGEHRIDGRQRRRARDSASRWCWTTGCGIGAARSATRLRSARRRCSMSASSRTAVRLSGPP